MVQSPLYARVIYYHNLTDFLYKYVFSSYITTLKSAVHNRATASKQPLTPWKHPIIVSMPKTPAFAPLAAEVEAEAISAIINTYSSSMNTASASAESVQILTQPSKADVKSALADC